MHKRLIAIAAVALTSFTLSVSAAEAAKPKKINVLILTGDDVSVHPWREVSQGTRDLLQASGKFEVKICEDTGILESTTALKRYDVVYMAMYNAKTPTLSDSAKQNLIEYIKGGKGFVLSHLSSGSFKEWDEFRKLSGRYWVFGKGNSGHGPRSVFKVKIANANHPITQGVQDFETDDELYARMQGDAPITVLATADSDWSKQTEPLAFTVEYGAGRVFHHTFGHDGKALANSNLQKLLQNGTQWAATGKVE
ncbi:MAG: ThuA domain-containing protein [Verrucomicrobiota bacterium]